ncbi:MAG TPA: YihY/virulence factor BrkB family protein [Chitinophagales bacterium]|nr:YihY/virulence factor BrkB family protein [Chitinophagales bacterium]
MLSLLQDSFGELKMNNPLQMAGATAFFTTFALPSILIIIIQVFGLFINERFISSELIKRLTQILGKAEGAQITQTLTNFRKLADNWYVTIGGFIFLMFVASTLFNEVKNSINQIWKIKVKTKPGLLFSLSIRGRSLIVIGLAGILFMIGFLTEGLVVFFGENLEQVLPGAGAISQGVVSELISVVIVSSWFILLFRFLADGRPSWKASIAGGTLTGILFTGGKLLLIWILPRTNISTIYGASGSVVLLLLFVFYSSFIRLWRHRPGFAKSLQNWQEPLQRGLKNGVGADLPGSALHSRLTAMHDERMHGQWSSPAVFICCEETC